MVQTDKEKLTIIMLRDQFINHKLFDKGWCFCINNSKTSCGSTDPQNRRIEISRLYVNSPKPYRKE